MRKVLLSLAVALAATSVPGPTSLPTVGPSYAATVDFANVADTVQAKKKKNKSKSSGNKIKLDDIGGVKRGKKDLKIRATVTEPGLTCYLVLTYKDGEADSPDIITSDNNRNCVWRIKIPKRDAAVGQATAALYVYDAQGRVEGTFSTLFDVL